MTKIDLCIIVSIWILPVFIMGIATHQNISFYESIVIGLIYSIILRCAWVLYTTAITVILEPRIYELECELEYIK